MDNFRYLHSSSTRSRTPHQEMNSLHSLPEQTVYRQLSTDSKMVDYRLLGDVQKYASILNLFNNFLS